MMELENVRVIKQSGKSTVELVKEKGKETFFIQCVVKPLALAMGI